MFKKGDKVRFKAHSKGIPGAGPWKDGDVLDMTTDTDGNPQVMIETGKPNVYGRRRCVCASPEHVKHKD